MNQCNHPKMKTDIICPDCGFLRLPIVKEIPRVCSSCGSTNINTERGILCNDCKFWEPRLCTPKILVQSHRSSIQKFVGNQLDEFPDKQETARRFGWPNEISDQKLIWLAVFLNNQKYSN